MSAEVVPYPFELLPCWSREEARLMQSVARALQPRVSSHTGQQLLQERWKAVLGGVLEGWPTAPTVLDRETLRRELSQGIVVAVFRSGTLGRFALIFDAPFVFSLADAALGTEAPVAESLRETLTPEREGALAVLCTQAARSLAPSPAPVWLGASERINDAVSVLSNASAVLWRWQLVCGLHAGEVVLVVDPARLLTHAPSDSSWLERWSTVRVSAELLCAREALSLEELASICVGDVLLFEGSMQLQGDELSGSLWLRLGALELPVTLQADRVVLAGEVNWMSSESKESSLGAEKAASLTTEVEVVLASSSFPLGEVAAWRPGEVVAFEDRIGAPVLVRAGGRAIARGELCAVEGAVGVRITELL